MPIFAVLQLTWMVFGLSWDVHPVEAGAHVRAHNVRATVHRDGRPMGVQRRLQNIPAFTQPVLDLCSSLVLRRNLHGTDRWRRCSDLGRGEPRAPLQPCEEAALPKHPGSLQSDLVAGVLSAGTSFVGVRLRDDNPGTFHGRAVHQLSRLMSDSHQQLPLGESAVLHPLCVFTG